MQTLLSLFFLTTKEFEKERFTSSCTVSTCTRDISQWYQCFTIGYQGYQRFFKYSVQSCTVMYLLKCDSIILRLGHVLKNRVQNTVRVHASHCTTASWYMVRVVGHH